MSEYGATAGCAGCHRQVDTINGEPGAVSMKLPREVCHTVACRLRFRMLLKDNDDDTGKNLNTTDATHFGAGMYDPSDCDPVLPYDGRYPLLAFKDRFRRPLNDYDDTMAGPILSFTVQEDGCDDRPRPKRLKLRRIETPGSLAGSPTNAGSSSQASNCSAKESTSDCSATEIKDEIEDVLTVDVSHSQPKEPQAIF